MIEILMYFFPLDPQSTLTRQNHLYHNSPPIHIHTAYSEPPSLDPLQLSLLATMANLAYSLPRKVSVRAIGLILTIGTNYQGFQITRMILQNGINMRE